MESLSLQHIELNWNQDGLDLLSLEALNSAVEVITSLVKIKIVTVNLAQTGFINKIVKMIKVNENPAFIATLMSCLLAICQNQEKIEYLVQEDNLAVLTNQIVSTHCNEKSLESLLNLFKSILQQTLCPIRFMMAVNLLRVVEENTSTWP